MPTPEERAVAGGLYHVSRTVKHHDDDRHREVDPEKWPDRTWSTRIDVEHQHRHPKVIECIPIESESGRSFSIWPSSAACLRWETRRKDGDGCGRKEGGRGEGRERVDGRVTMRPQKLKLKEFGFKISKVSQRDKEYKYHVSHGVREVELRKGQKERGTHAIREMTALVRVAAVASLRRRRACPALLIRRCFVSCGDEACIPPAPGCCVPALWLLTGAAG